MDLRLVTSSAINQSKEVYLAYNWSGSWLSSVVNFPKVFFVFKFFQISVQFPNLFQTSKLIPTVSWSVIRLFEGASPRIGTARNATVAFSPSPSYNAWLEIPSPWSLQSRQPAFGPNGRLMDSRRHKWRRRHVIFCWCFVSKVCMSVQERVQWTVRVATLEIAGCCSKFGVSQFS